MGPGSRTSRDGAYLALKPLKHTLGSVVREGHKGWPRGPRGVQLSGSMEDTQGHRQLPRPRSTRASKRGRHTLPAGATTPQAGFRAFPPPPTGQEACGTDRPALFRNPRAALLLSSQSGASRGRPQLSRETCSEEQKSALRGLFHGSPYLPQEGSQEVKAGQAAWEPRQKLLPGLGVSHAKQESDAEPWGPWSTLCSVPPTWGSPVPHHRPLSTRTQPGVTRQTKLNHHPHSQTY